MTRTTAPGWLAQEAVEPPPARSIVLIGMMGAGKTSIGRRLAVRLGLPFRDADSEIEQAAGLTVPELFARYGEPHFRAGERRVIDRLLDGPPIVLATGGGAMMDASTREAVRQHGVSVWLRCPLPVLVRRVTLRSTRPMLQGGNPAEILARLLEQRSPVYAEADIVVDCTDEPPDVTCARVADALRAWRPSRRLPVRSSRQPYEVVIGGGLLRRAGGLLARHLPQKRVVVITDRIVGPLHGPALLAGLRETGIDVRTITVAPGEGSKSLAVFETVMDELLGGGAERRTAVVALGGGVVGDLAGFVAATALRGLPFIQVPTTLLAQVDSSVGGKTGLNTARGKNLVGAFHPPLAVLADTDTLATLPPRERQAGYAEIVKAGLIGDAGFYEWCERHGAGVVGDDADAQAEAIWRACAFKAAVVGDDEREEKPSDGRALLNLGHTFAHAIEGASGYGAVLHGEAVAVGLGLAFRLSARLGHCDPAIAPRVEAHLEAVGLPPDLSRLNRRFSAADLVGRMRRDKKMRDGQLHFVLARGIGAAFTSADVPEDAVLDILRDSGCSA